MSVNKTIKVVLIDDDTPVRHVINRLLTRKLHVEVIEAKNGAEGLQLIRRHKPDFILLDVNMPVLSGIDVLRTLRSNEQFKNLPAIVFTSEKSKSTFAELIALGVSDYLLKPIDFESGLSRIRNLIGTILKKGDEVTGQIPQHSVDPAKLIIADTDKNFRQFVKGAFADRFDTLEAETGIQALELYLRHYPKYVLIGEQLPLLNEFALAKKIRQQTRQLSQMYYIRSENNDDADIPPDYDGGLFKIFDPMLFMRAFVAKVFGGQDDPVGIEGIAREYLPMRLHMYATDLFLSSEDHENIFLAATAPKFKNHEICARVRLDIKGAARAFFLETACSIEDAQWRLRQKDKTLNPTPEDCSEFLRKTIVDLADKTQIDLHGFGIKLEEQPSIVKFEPPEEYQSDNGGAKDFVNEDGHRFYASIRLID